MRQKVPGEREAAKGPFVDNWPANSHNASTPRSKSIKEVLKSGKNLAKSIPSSRFNHINTNDKKLQSLTDRFERSEKRPRVSQRDDAPCTNATSPLSATQLRTPLARSRSSAHQVLARSRYSNVVETPRDAIFSPCTTVEDLIENTVRAETGKARCVSKRQVTKKLIVNKRHSSVGCTERSFPDRHNANQEEPNASRPAKSKGSNCAVTMAVSARVAQFPTIDLQPDLERGVRSRGDHLNGKLHIGNSKRLKLTCRDEIGAVGKLAELNPRCQRSCLALSCVDGI